MLLKNNWKLLFVLLLFTTALMSMTVLGTWADAGPLSQEYSGEWSDTTIYTWGIVAGDVDDDGVIEIIDVGFMRDPSDGRDYGFLDIWTWNGEQVSYEGGLFGEDAMVNEMETYPYRVDVGDIDGEGTLEIVITGIAWDTSLQIFGGVQVYSWNGVTLDLWDTIWTEIQQGDEVDSCAVKVSDLNGDGLDEVVTCGSVYAGINPKSQLRVWGWNGAHLQLEANDTWALGDVGYSCGRDVAIGVLDGELKIVTVGDYLNGGKLWGEVRIWSYGPPLTVELSQVWESEYSIHASGVFIADNKIYTVEGSDDIVKDRGEIRVWSASLALEGSTDWCTVGDTYVHELFVADIDGDGDKEVVTVGETNDGNRENAELRTWERTSSLSLKDSETWYITDNTYLFSVFVADVDDDGVNEILTAGFANINELAQVTIWSYPDVKSPKIVDLNPEEDIPVPNTKPEISASFSDDYSGINVDSVSVRVDGTDVTSSATITATGVSYTPTSDLSEGSVTVTVEIADKSGNTGTATWSFTVTAPAPGISGFSLEGIMVGIAAAAIAIFLIKKRSITSMSPTSRT